MFTYTKKVFTTVLIAVVFTGCVPNSTVNIPQQVAEVRPGILQGYLHPKDLPNSMVLVPSSSKEGYASKAYDDAVAQAALKLQGTPRWEVAARDAVLHFPEAAKIFSCAFGLEISKENTPHTYMLLRRTLADAGLSTYGAKKHYQRKRPFMSNHAPICTPHEQKELEKDGSYPSGHSAIGWAWALILSEISPSHADALLARGRAFGQSRVVCNVHWQSDVNEGRIMGAAAVAKLHSDPVFLAEIEAAKKEVRHLREEGFSKLPSSCKQEGITLGISYKGIDD